MRVRTEARREAILETAARVFMELGYERTSMAGIARRVGGSKATLYGYFASKEELFMSVLVKRLGGRAEPLFRELPTLAHEAPRTVLVRLGVSFASAITTAEALAFKRLIIATMTDRDEAQRFWELGNNLTVESIRSYLIAATRAGNLAVKRPLVAARQLLSLYEAEINWSGPMCFELGLTRAQIRKAIERAVDVFLAAYGAVSR